MPGTASAASWLSDVLDLGALTDADLVLLGETPSAALGTTRDKPDAGMTEAALSAFDNLKARAFIYTGGNDKAATLDLLRQHSTGACHFVHAPKTIDNDLMGNDHTPGFISAASVVAHAFTSVDRFLADIEAVDRRPGRCVVSMSDGVQDETGLPFAEAPAKAAGAWSSGTRGNVQPTGGDLGMEIGRVLKARFPEVRSHVDTRELMAGHRMDDMQERERSLQSASEQVANFSFPPRLGRPRRRSAAAASMTRSQVGLLREHESIVNLDPEVTDRALQLAMPE